MPVLPGKIAVLYLLNAKATMKLPLHLTLLVSCPLSLLSLSIFLLLISLSFSLSLTGTQLQKYHFQPRNSCAYTAGAVRGCGTFSLSLPV